LAIAQLYAKPGFIFSETADHSSLARFVERVFGSDNTLADLDPAAQDAEANDLLGARFMFRERAALTYGAPGCASLQEKDER